MTSNQIGAVYMMVAMTAYTLNDAMVKLLGADLPLWQIMLLRGVLASVLLFALARVLREKIWVSGRREWGFVLLRAAFEVGATYFFLTALLAMPIANATAVMQAIPLTVTLAAALFLPEKVGWRRSLAIVVGFLGMLLIVRPGTAGFGQGTVFVLIAVLLITGRDILTRFVPAGVPSMAMAITTAVGVALFGGVSGVGQDWVAVTPFQLGLLLATSGLILCGYVFSILSMRGSEVSFTAPFRYSGLVVALMVGLLVFDEWPDAITLVGAAIVVGAGLFTLARENQRKRERARS
ncbi:EamA family transporter [Epibacterium sp. SM1979]|uniref:EamA family transporter n=1 Tax=Tritonibacter litoralis TaxID=2662264 RepID=A0A843YGE2_9RHOB|nr:DMT family transporter [Tritonibacter litoralis]MQQ08362.1 EamA family transporter [Tritonibacter litoralis]